MNSDNKVFIETTTLIAASIYWGEGKYKHKEYDNSKTLIKFFRKNIQNQIGHTSDTVIEQSWRKLEKAIANVLEESEDSEFKAKEPTKYFNLLSQIKDNSEDRLKDNIKVLTKMPIDEEKVNEIKSKELVSFFGRIVKEIKEKAHFNWQGVRLHRSTRKMIARTNRPYLKSIPDSADFQIFSEAIFIKRTFFSKNPYYLASLDTHFSPARKDSFVRDELDRKFNIKCDWPSEIFKELKK